MVHNENCTGKVAFAYKTRDRKTRDLVRVYMCGVCGYREETKGVVASGQVAPFFAQYNYTRNAPSLAEALDEVSRAHR